MERYFIVSFGKAMIRFYTNTHRIEIVAPISSFIFKL